MFQCVFEILFYPNSIMEAHPDICIRFGIIEPRSFSKTIQRRVVSFLLPLLPTNKNDLCKTHGTGMILCRRFTKPFQGFAIIFFHSFF